MKIQMILLCLLFSNAIAFADGPIYIPIQLLIETKSGEKMVAWIDYMIQNDMNEIDSVKQEGYLKKYLDGQNCIDSFNCFEYYRYMVHYSLEFFDDKKQRIKYESFTKLELGNLSNREIRNVSVLQVDDERKKWNDTNTVYFMSIENQIDVCDTLWMKKEPIQRFTFNGDACSFKLIVHERNSKTDALVKELKKLEMQLLNDPARDEKMLIRLQKIKGLKVIVLVPPCLC
ncbi:MAG: hypothetical protein K9I36_14020 [Bacteroidia bacterium]|nr:hypothetical protein [Bacteroidia bacterium]